jgi:hypothetical protein
VHSLDDVAHLLGRFVPAHAEDVVRERRPTTVDANHPRVCGTLEGLTMRCEDLPAKHAV